ncbi:MAG: PEGA domain-containing protein [Desulfuromonadales bacterium]|nr:PEGA domain-containing protein [Desulfuromonadales bacterium]
MLQRFIAIALLALLTSACAAQQTAFISNPPGAEVLVDGAAIGTTPCSFDYNLGNGESHEVTINKEGYDSIRFVVKTDEVDIEARNRWLAAGVVWSPLWVGTFFTKKYKDSYDFVLRAEPPTMTAKTAPSQAPETL